MQFNCDMGEGLIDDALVMPLIQQANIACGGHAGDDATMQTAVQLAKQHQVKIGAHPSYPDPTNFGRQSMSLSDEALRNSLSEQVNRLSQICDENGVTLHHIKPHGALYLDMMKNIHTLHTLLGWMQDTFPGLPLMLQGGIDNVFFENQARPFGVSLMFEAFADRAYQANGHLMPRSEPNSLYTTPDQIIEQTQRFQHDIWADSLCFHSDNPASVSALQQLAAQA